MHKHRDIIVIHGWGGTFLDALHSIRGLASFRTRWENGAFLVPRRSGSVLRDLLFDPEPGAYGLAFQKLILSRMLEACGTGGGDQPAAGEGEMTRFAERQIRETFGWLGIPWAPAARHRRSIQLHAEALAAIEPLMATVDALEQELRGKDGRMATEAEARAMLRRHAVAGRADDLVALFEKIRDMHETGGDLDTVASAALYAHALCAAARQEGREPMYGRDYRYAFVNYHESLKALAALAPANVYVADLPIGAFPEFETDVRALDEKGISFARFEDHHPFTHAQRDMLRQLVKDNLLGYLGLSGPVHGEAELPADALKCGADMVYESMVRGHPWDLPGARALRSITHSEDLALERQPLGRLLTELIKGGICKVELVQLLVEAMATDDLEQRLRDRGWEALTRKWREDLTDVETDLLENVYAVNFKRPSVASPHQGGPAIHPGSDMPAPTPPVNAPSDRVRVLLALAPGSEPGKPRIGVGKAVEFFSRHEPQTDYLFYCYGARLMVTRRLNQADFSFQLGALMPQLGGEADGGHAGAAVCRPDSNPHYPTHLLGRVNGTNFHRFVHYLASRMEELEYEPISVENRSDTSTSHMRGGGRKMILVVAVAVLIGTLLALFHPLFRRASIAESNEQVFTQIQDEDWLPGEETSEEAP